MELTWIEEGRDEEQEGTGNENDSWIDEGRLCGGGKGKDEVESGIEDEDNWGIGMEDEEETEDDWGIGMEDEEEKEDDWGIGMEDEEEIEGYTAGITGWEEAEEEGRMVVDGGGIRLLLNKEEPLDGIVAVGGGGGGGGEIFWVKCTCNSEEGKGGCWGETRGSIGFDEVGMSVDDTGGFSLVSVSKGWWICWQEPTCI